MPGKDILVTDDSVIVRLVIPGAIKEELELSMTESKLKVRVKLDPNHQAGGILTNKDYKRGFIKRTIRLPRKVIPDKMEVNFVDSVLEVRIARQDQQGWIKPNRVDEIALKSLEGHYKGDKVGAPQELINYLLSYKGDNFMAINSMANVGDPIIDNLINASKNPDWVVRRNACDVLRRIDNPRVVLPIISLLTDIDKHVRRVAASACQIKDERLVLPLIDAVLKDPDYEVRTNAALCLGNLKDKRAIPALRKVKDMPDDILGFFGKDTKEQFLKSAAKTSLDILEDLVKQELRKSKIMPLLDLLEDVDVNVRLQAAKSLVNYAKCLDGTDATRLIEELNYPFKDYQDAIGLVLIKMDDSVVLPLIDALKSPNEDVCSYAATALGKIGDPRAVLPLIKVLTSSIDYEIRPHAGEPEWNIKVISALALGKIGDPRALQPLINTLEDPDPNVRFAATGALGILGDSDAVWHLIKTCTDSNPYVRLSSVKALGELGDHRACSELKVTFGREDIPTIKFAAIESLSKIGGQRAYSELSSILEIYAKDPEYKKAAADALLKLDKKK